MRKFQDPLQTTPANRKRSRVPAALALCLCLLASPLVYEGGKVLLSRWMSMTGAHHEPDTPILDAIGGWSRDANQEFSRYTSRLVSGGSWRASTAVPLAIGWGLVMGFIFLRRGR